MMEQMRAAPPARTVVCLALMVYSVAIINLAWTPTDDISWAEWYCGFIAWVSIIGLLAHATEAIRFPGERYSYLVTGYAGFTTMLLYLIDADDMVGRKVAVTLMLLTGVVGSYGAYLAQIDEYGGEHGR